MSVRQIMEWRPILKLKPAFLLMIFLIGGGFMVDWHGAGNLGTAFFPSTEFSWKARSKDHGIDDPSNLRIFAIGIRRNLPVGQVKVSITQATSGQSPHPAAVATVAPWLAVALKFTGMGLGIFFGN